MEDSRIYLLTGAAGFLGNNIARQLVEKGCRVRGLVLKGDKAYDGNQVLLLRSCR